LPAATARLCLLLLSALGERLVVGRKLFARAAIETPAGRAVEQFALLSAGGGERHRPRRLRHDRDQRPLSRVRGRLNSAACNESPATSGRIGKPRPMRRASASTPLRASAIGTSAPITRSR